VLPIRWNKIPHLLNLFIISQVGDIPHPKILSLKHKGIRGILCFFYSSIAEVPGAARVNLQPAEHLKNVFFSFYGFKPPGPKGEGAGIKPALKSSLDRWGCAWKISSRSVQGFGFPLALHIPTDKQTSVHPFLYI